MAENTIAETIWDEACKWAVKNFSDDTAQIRHYPLFCLQVLRGKSWEQVEDDAQRTYIRSLSLRKLKQFERELFHAAEGEQIAILQRRAYNHHSKELFCKMMGRDPREGTEICVTNPYLDGVSEAMSLEIQTGTEGVERMRQMMMDEAIRDLDFVP